MTYSLRREYERMRPLEEGREPATVWGNLHRKAWDPIPFLLRQSAKASAWVETDRKFMVGPGSRRQKKRVRKARREKEEGWSDLSKEQEEIKEAWWTARRLRDAELIPLKFIPWGQDFLPAGFSNWQCMVWAARVPYHAT